jgi:hypothetical protein
MNRKHLLALFCLSLGLSALPSFAAKGVPPARYTDRQMADLAIDLGTVLRSEYRMRYINSNVRAVAVIVRQKELLGISEDGETGDLLIQARNWWKDNVVGPAMRVANNPAASCRVAQVVITKLMEAERQSQLLGMDTSADVDPTNPDSLLSKAVVAVKKRCLEQAFYDCMESGNGQHIAVMLAAAVRQFQVLGLEDFDFEARAVYLFRRCTVYQLRYHPRTRVDGKSYIHGTVQDGSVILLSDVDPMGGMAGMSQPHEWNGPRPVDPLDVIQSTTECDTRAKRTRIVCGPPEPKFPARAKIKAGNFAMQRYFNDVKIVEEGSFDDARDVRGYRIRMTSERKSEGTNVLALTFEPPMVFTMATLTSPELSMSLPMPPSKTAFLTAHGRGRSQDIELSGWTRVGNDVLFEKAIAGEVMEGKIKFADNSKFELVHRPDLFPPEEIVAKWEVAPPADAPMPNRTPAQPGARPK